MLGDLGIGVLQFLLLTIIINVGLREQLLFKAVDCFQ